MRLVITLMTLTKGWAPWSLPTIDSFIVKDKNSIQQLNWELYIPHSTKATCKLSSQTENEPVISQQQSTKMMVTNPLHKSNCNHWSGKTRHIPVLSGSKLPLLNILSVCQQGFLAHSSCRGNNNCWKWTICLSVDRFFQQILCRSWFISYKHWIFLKLH